MTLKEIKTEFKLVPFDTVEIHTYLVYPKGENFRGYYQYLCSIYKKGNKVGIVNTYKLYDNLEDLKDGIEKYIESLEFTNHFYNPMYREGIFEEYVINDYLINRGFTQEGGYQNISTYKYIGKNVYNGVSNEIVLNFNNLDTYNGISNSITVSLMTGEWSWIEKKCKREVHEIIKTIDSLLKPLFIGDSVINLKQAEKFNTEQFMASLKQVNTSNLEVISVEYKDQLRKELTELLNKL